MTSNEPQQPPFARPKHVRLQGGPHDGKTIGVGPSVQAIHFAAEPNEIGWPQQHRYRVEGDVGTYEGTMPLVDAK